MRAGGRALAAHDGGRLPDQAIVGEGVHHEQREIGPASAVACQDWIPDMVRPDRKTLAVALFPVRSTHDGPRRVGAEDSPAGLDLVPEVGEADQTRE